MNKSFRLVSQSIYVSILLYTGCSGSDEPKPVDCSKSDLAITLSASGDIDPTGCSTNDGSIQVEATGGKEPYKFAIGTGSFVNGSLFSNLGSGSFSIAVKDANDCVKDFIVTLVAPGAPTAEVDLTKDTNCTAPGNGTITVEASGGTGSYEYKLDAGAFVSNPLFENVKSGAHTIVVKDDENCTVTVNTTVLKGITGIDYVNDIRPIFVAKCQFSGCHPDNGDWFTYSVAKSHAADIKSKTGSGAMPKGGGAEQGGPLSETQIALIACWVNDGAPQN